MFGCSIFRTSLQESADLIVKESEILNASIVVTPNVDHVVKLQRNSKFRDAYNAADMFFADGAPIIFLSRLLPGNGLSERVTGADLFPLVCEKASHLGLSVAVIGTSDRIAQSAVQRLKVDFPTLHIAGHYSPPMGFERMPEETRKIIDMCNTWKPNILVLALGAPKQELWAAAHKAELKCGVILCFGAAVDFYSGVIKRAPVFFRRNGLEWLWRLGSEPKRLWRRYLLEDPYFLFMAIEMIVKSWGKRYFDKYVFFFLF